MNFHQAIVSNHLEKPMYSGQFYLNRRSELVNFDGSPSSQHIPEKFNMSNPHTYFSFDQDGGAVDFTSTKQDAIPKAFRFYQAVLNVLVGSLHDRSLLPVSKDSTDADNVIEFGFSFNPKFLDQLADGVANGIQADDLPTILFEGLAEKYAVLEEELNQVYGFRSLALSENDFIQLQMDVDLGEMDGTNIDRVRFAHLVLLSLVYFDEGPANLDALLENIQAMLKAMDVGITLDQLTDLELVQPAEAVTEEEALQVMQDHKNQIMDLIFNLRGFEEMEMSTQMLFYDAIEQGIGIEILDYKDHMVRLTYGDHEEILQQGNRSSRVTYISSLIMENKYATKLLLDEAGYATPPGQKYLSAQEAKNNYWRFKDGGVVVKPNSTNKGIGITIFKEAVSEDQFAEAVDFAFSHDSTILVEKYIEGTEYRFHIINGKCKDVMLRKPANVVGDGQHTIRQLVEIKNQDPLRGVGGVRPLEKISLGRTEEIVLESQGYTVDDVPEQGLEVQLRVNSNLSTGGDNETFKDIMHEDYIRISEEIAQTLGGYITGVDMIVDDYTRPSTPETPGYACIETNTNPGMFGHMYVAIGTGTRLTMHLLEELFPELEIGEAQYDEGLR